MASYYLVKLILRNFFEYSIVIDSIYQTVFSKGRVEKRLRRVP
jgi:hypothetical protein